MTSPEQPSSEVTTHSRRLLLHVLGAADFDGNDLLLGQAESVHVVGGVLTMLELEVDPGLPPAPCPDGPIPVSTLVRGEDGRPLGELLIWISSGRLSTLEYAWFSDAPPDRLPDVDQLTVGASPSG